MFDTLIVEFSTYEVYYRNNGTNERYTLKK